MTITTDNGLNQRVSPQFMMVIEIFMAGNQTKNSLTKHAQIGMFDFPGLSNIKGIQQFTGAPGQTEFAVEFFNKNQPAVTADIAAAEIEFDFSAFRTLKERNRNVTFCHRQILTLYCCLRYYNIIR